jgi:hypothetical protein
MAYQTVFETGITRCPFWFPAFGLVFTVIGFGLLKWHDGLLAVNERWPNRRWPIRAPSRGDLKAFGWMFLVGSCIWMLVALSTVTAECHHCMALRRGTARVVEGRVADFTPMPRAGHQDETFRVGEVRFAYSDYQASCGFSTSASHGGPVHEGLQVRIHYADRVILKLEIAR